MAGTSFFTPIRDNRFLRGRSFCIAFRCRAYFCGIRLIRSYIQFLHFVCIPLSHSLSLIFQFELLFPICSFAFLMFVSIKHGRATDILIFSEFYLYYFYTGSDKSDDANKRLNYRRIWKIFWNRKKSWPDNWKIESYFQEYFHPDNLIYISFQEILFIFLYSNTVIVRWLS